MTSRTSLANDRYRTQKQYSKSEIPDPPSDLFILIDHKGDRVDITADELRKRILKGKVSPSNRIFDWDRAEWLHVGDISMPREVIVRDVYLPTASVARLVLQVFISSIPWMLIFGFIYFIVALILA